MIRVSATAPCTSNADDLAFHSLADAVRAMEGMPDARVVGGHMVGLLLTAFPLPGLEVRRTTDADAGLSTAIATSGGVRTRLLELGYVQVNGSRYERDGRTVDLLVEVPDSKFAPRPFVGGQLDGSPGLDLAILADPIEIDNTVVHTDGSDERFTVRTPTVEYATIIKAYAAGSRGAAKDIADIYQLLEIREQHGREAIGGWQLDSEPPTGRRLDASRVLRRVKPDDPRFREAGINATRCIELIREHIAAS